MCAMLAIIVPKELGVAQWRATFFLESYLGWFPLFCIDANSCFLRAFGKTAIARPSGEDTEAYRVGGDQILCPGEVISKLH